MQPDDSDVTFAELDNPNVVIPSIVRVNSYMPGVEQNVAKEQGVEHELLIRTKPYLTTAGITATMNGNQRHLRQSGSCHEAAGAGEYGRGPL